MEPANERLRARTIGTTGRAKLAWMASTFLWIVWIVGTLGTIGTGARTIAGAAESAATEPSTVQLPELLNVLRANLAGATPEELNQAAVAGLLDRLAPRVVLLESNSSVKPTPPQPESGLTTAVFDRTYGYIRLAGLGPETGREFQSAIEGLASSNKLRGLIVDLRFTAGGDYGAAVAVADRFFGRAQDLVDWGEGMKRSTTKSNIANAVDAFITWPTTVLMNRHTAGPAEVLAGILRHGEAALLVGTNTAAQAGVTREFTLKTGQRLRMAVAPVKVLSDHELPFTGLTADIEVGVDPDEERLFLTDAYRVIKPATPGNLSELAAASTNNRPRRRMNEAELVRMAREGQDPRAITGTPPASTPRAPEPAGPTVTDPVLARALDILKGVAVVQRFHGP